MKILIEIPAAYESEFKRDKFEESLKRLMSDAHSMAGDYEKETAGMLITAFKKSSTWLNDDYCPNCGMEMK